MGHQMHEFGSLLSCDFACNPNIWSCKGFYRQYVARFSVSGAQIGYSANLLLLPKSGRETFLNYPNGQVKTQSRSKRRGVRLLLMTG